MKHPRLSGFLRSPGAAVSAACLCLILGFFLGSAVTHRHRGEPVVAVQRAALPEQAAGAVNINSADEALLQTLPGIGPKLAGEIVAYREEHGPFRYLYELTDVKGIGGKTYEALLGLITID